MNHIMQKCILTMEEESRHINLTKRCGVSCISRKRSIPWEENTPENFSAKRARKQIPNRKLKISRDPEVPNNFLIDLPVLGKLSSPIVPGVSGISRKRSIPWDENTPENFSAKRARKQIPKRMLKISREPEVPNDFLIDLPVLLDTDPSDWEEGSPKSELQAAKSKTEDSRNLFTYQQLKLICCEMMNQCENRVVQEYEVALTQKMAEQYDTFIKFNHDQLQRECEHKASYLL
ncbi:akirin isoform X2 [Drosophila yakuba]|uniref:Uncharacterized protein, isoform D n=1 Tax=Drosophila yakuba TaxID=7245 RepID=A0A0R1DNS8_DROYA|nr:akirin isoform X2 [Drosophila yakuba]KRJ98971.1 uncharacterized protein Dyak_GE27292, isoform D [Drosophila yakuba]